MERALFVSLFVAVVGLSLGCGDDAVCGPEGAAVDGITVAVGGATIVYGGFTSSPNNDCPDPAGGPTSLTLDGIQKSPSPAIPFHMTFCLPSPDDIAEQPIALAGDDRLQVIDASGELAGCVLARDPAQQASGTISFTGYCGDGIDPAGYAIELTGTVPAIRRCDGMADEPVTLNLSGRAAVDAL